MDFDQPHDNSCDGACILWDGESKFTTSSFASETTQNSHHHIDTLPLQKASSKEAATETSAFPLGMTSLGTATRSALSTRTVDQVHRHVAMNKTGATVIPPLEPTTTPSGRMPTESESSLFEAAVCDATTLLCDETHEFSAEERTGNKTLTNKAKHTLSNVNHPARLTTHLIAHKIQGQGTRLPLNVLMDPGSHCSFMHERVTPKGAVPKIIRPRAT